MAPSRDEDYGPRLMNILFITAEVEPLSGHGPIAQVCHALPKALKSQDHQVHVLSPLYKGIDPTEHALARRLSKLKHTFAGQEWSCELWTGRTISGAELTFIGHEDLFHRADSITDGDDKTIVNRIAAFARSAVVLLEKNEQEWQAIHAHGWFGAGVLAALKAAGVSMPMVLSVHDPADRGNFGLEHSETLGTALGGHPDLLAAGIAAADHVVIGSKAAREALGTGEVIENGIDSGIWNPVTDPLLTARFDPIDLRGKATNKADVQREMGLPVRTDAPLVVVVSHGGEDRGLDIVAKAASQILRNDAQVLLALEGEQDGELVAAFEDVWDRWPDRFQVRTNVDETLVHRAIAAADFVLFPARRHTNAMRAKVAQRYGALPIGAREGAFAEALVDCDAQLETGNAILFDSATSESLLSGVRRAFSAFTFESFRGVQQRTMRIDASWDRSARLFERLYQPAEEDIADI